MARILLLYDSRGGLIEQLADALEAGVADAGAACRRRKVAEAIPADLRWCDGLLLGSPNWSGMTGAMKQWWDYSGDLWQSAELAGKVAGVFTAGHSRSAGIEATLQQLMHLVLAHGMLFVGLPWSDAMRVSGSYYGATAHGVVNADDRAQARALGARVTSLAAQLSRPALGR